MNKVFHQLVPLIALKFMPQSFRDFLISDGYTEENIKTGLLNDEEKMEICNGTEFIAEVQYGRKV